MLALALLATGAAFVWRWRLQRHERAAARDLERANRLYATLARANEAALSAQSRDELSQEICEALVGNAGMRLAWIGWEDPRVSQLAIIAVAGEARGYVEGLVISTDPANEKSRGPTGRAVLTGLPQVCQDMETAPDLAPWRERQRHWGIRSSAAVRLLDADGTRGTLTFYSAEPGFFTDEIMRLVMQMVGDFTRALEVLEARRQLAERTTALRESEHRYRSLFEQNHAAILLIDPGDGRIVDANEAAGRFYGYGRRELRQLHISDLNVSPIDVLRAEMSALLESGGSRTYHFVHRLADGARRSVEVVSGPMLIEGRRLLFSIVHDETDRIRAERELRASEERSKLAMEAAHQGAWELDLETGVAQVSPEYARILGYLPQEFSESLAAWSERLHPEDRASAVRAFEDFVNGARRDYHVEFRQRTKSGEWKWVQSHAQIVERNPLGSPRRIIGIHMDITERKQAEQVLRSAAAGAPHF